MSKGKKRTSGAVGTLGVEKRRPRTDVKDLLQAWQANEGNAAAVAEALGIKEGSVIQRIYALRKKKVNVPRFARPRKNAVNVDELNTFISSLVQN